MKGYQNMAQLFPCIALGMGFLSAVLNRIGWLDNAGQLNIA